MHTGTYLRSPSTSGRSFVMAMTRANNVTKVVMKATGELQVKIGSETLDLYQHDEYIPVQKLHVNTESDDQISRICFELYVKSSSSCFELAVFLTCISRTKLNVRTDDQPACSLSRSTIG